MGKCYTHEPMDGQGDPTLNFVGRHRAIAMPSSTVSERERSGTIKLPLFDD